MPNAYKRATRGTNFMPKRLGDGAWVFIWCVVISLVCIYSSVIGMSRLLISRMIAPKKC
jgi:hypothetical protein